METNSKQNSKWMTSLKKEERKRKKNWKGQLQNCGHHLERVLSVLLNQLPRIGCPFNARTCPFSFLSLSLPPLKAGRKVSVSSGREKRHRNSRLYEAEYVSRVRVCVRAWGHESGDTLTLRKLAAPRDSAWIIQLFRRRGRLATVIRGETRPRVHSTISLESCPG